MKDLKKTIASLNEKEKDVIRNVYCMGFINEVSLAGSLFNFLHGLLEYKMDAELMHGFIKTGFNEQEQEDFMEKEGYKIALFIAKAENRFAENISSEGMSIYRDYWVQTGRHNLLSLPTIRHGVPDSDEVQNFEEADPDIEMESGMDSSGLIAQLFKYFSFPYYNDQSVLENLREFRKLEPNKFREFALAISAIRYTDNNYFFHKLIGSCIESSTGMLAGNPNDPSVQAAREDEGIHKVLRKNLGARDLARSAQENSPEF